MSASSEDGYEQDLERDALARLHAGLLAQRMLGSKRRTDRYRPREVLRNQDRPRKILGNASQPRHAMEQRSAMGKRKPLPPRVMQKRIARERQEVRRAARPRGHPATRCYDWMVHSGNIHYAHNGSSFDSYVKIDANASSLLGFGGKIRAIGIGTVRLQVRRTLTSDDVCELTLHDVLHIPAMPCNGVSMQKFQDAGFSISMEADKITFATWSQAPLLTGSMEGRLYKLALVGNPVGERPWAGDVRPLAISLCSSDEERLAQLGRAAREIQGVDRRFGHQWVDHGCLLEC